MGSLASWAVAHTLLSNHAADQALIHLELWHHIAVLLLPHGGRPEATRRFSSKMFATYPENKTIVLQQSLECTCANGDM